MPEPRPAAPRPVSTDGLARLRSHLGALNTAVLQRLDAAAAEQPHTCRMTRP